MKTLECLDSTVVMIELKTWVNDVVNLTNYYMNIECGSNSIAIGIEKIALLTVVCFDFVTIFASYILTNLSCSTFLCHRLFMTNNYQEYFNPKILQCKFD